MRSLTGIHIHRDVISHGLLENTIYKLRYEAGPPSEGESAVPIHKVLHSEKKLMQNKHLRRSECHVDSWTGRRNRHACSCGRFPLNNPHSVTSQYNVKGNNKEPFLSLQYYLSSNTGRNVINGEFMRACFQDILTGHGVTDECNFWFNELLVYHAALWPCTRV